MKEKLEADLYRKVNNQMIYIYNNTNDTEKKKMRINNH